jgi:hypothetical protein
LQQLTRRRSTIPSELQKVYHHHEEYKTRPSVSEYSALLELELSSFSEAFIVIDALDECLNNEGTRDALLTEIQKLQPRLRLLITSRPNVKDLDLKFGNASQLEICASDSDIKQYLESEIDKKERLRAILKTNLSLRDTVTNTILQKAEGMSVPLQCFFNYITDHL